MALSTAAATTTSGVPPIPTAGTETPQRLNYRDQGTPTSTKAVLQALRALQAKITRLERERVAALNTATELRLKLELAEARASEEVASVRCERKTTDRRLDDAEQTARDAQKAVLDRDAKVRTLEDQVQQLRGDLRVATVGREAAEAERTQSSAELAAARSALTTEKANADALTDRLAHLESKIVQLELRNESLEAISQSVVSRPPPPPPVRRRPKPAVTKVPEKTRHVVKVPTAKSVDKLPVTKKKVVTKKAVTKKVPLQKKAPAPTDRRIVDNGLRIALADAIRATDDPGHVKDLTAIFQRITNASGTVVNTGGATQRQVRGNK